MGVLSSALAVSMLAFQRRTASPLVESAQRGELSCRRNDGPQDYGSASACKAAGDDWRSRRLGASSGVRRDHESCLAPAPRSRQRSSHASYRPGGSRAIVVMSLFLAPACSFLSSDDRPHIVPILVDALRRDHLPTYGCEKPTAPFLERLAMREVVFDNARAQSSVTFLHAPQGDDRRPAGDAGCDCCEGDACAANW